MSAKVKAMAGPEGPTKASINIIRQFLGLSRVPFFENCLGGLTTVGIIGCERDCIVGGSAVWGVEA